MRDSYDTPGDDDVVAATHRVAEARGIESAQVALAWLLSKPAVTAPIIGATKLEHLESALRALDVHLDDAECRALEAPYRPHAVRSPLSLRPAGALGLAMGAWYA